MAARNGIGLEVEEAARASGLKVERLQAAEAGEADLSLAQLKKLAAVYRRPLAAFFDPDPPAPPAPIHDFRGGSRGTVVPTLRVAVRRAQEKRDDALELARATEADLPAFALSAALTDAPEDVAARLRTALDLPDGPFLRNDRAWQLRKQSVEHLGVLVFEVSRIEIGAMRGLSIPLDLAPIVIINGADSHTGRSFTLVHEVAHLMLRQGGVCDLEPNESDEFDEHVEVFCNAVAGATLVPEDTLLSMVPTTHRDWSMDDLAPLARFFSVSKEVVLRRLLELDRATRQHYQAMRQEFEREYAQLRSRPAGGGGPSPAVMAVRNLGRPFVALVLDAYDRDQIGLATVSDYLGVKLKHLPRIRDLVNRG